MLLLLLLLLLNLPHELLHLLLVGAHHLRIEGRVPAHLGHHLHLLDLQLLLLYLMLLPLLLLVLLLPLDGHGLHLEDLLRLLDLLELGRLLHLELVLRGRLRLLLVAAAEAYAHIAHHTYFAVCHVAAH